MTCYPSHRSHQELCFISVSIFDHHWCTASWWTIYIWQCTVVKAVLQYILIFNYHLLCLNPPILPYLGLKSSPIPCKYQYLVRVIIPLSRYYFPCLVLKSKTLGYSLLLGGLLALRNLYNQFRWTDPSQARSMSLISHITQVLAHSHLYVLFSLEHHKMLERLYVVVTSSSAALSLTAATTAANSRTNKY